jgi:antitoxin VapB
MRFDADDRPCPRGLCYGIGLEVIVPEHRVVSLFRNGRNQAIRIPREFELDAEEATIRREGERLIVEPVPRPGLLAYLRTLEPLDVPFPDVDDDLQPLDEPVV